MTSQEKNPVQFIVVNYRSPDGTQFDGELLHPYKFDLVSNLRQHLLGQTITHVWIIKLKTPEKTGIKSKST